MRVATYNIRDGGVDGGSASRLDDVLSVLRGMDADVVALQEANGFGTGRRMQAVAAALGMRGALCETRSGFDLALFVRPPLRIIRRGVARSGFHHGACYVDIAGPGVAPVRVVTAHLSPFDGSQRLAEGRRLLRRVAVGSRVILMGDFNSLDRSRDHSRDLERLSAADRQRYLLPGSHEVDTRVIDLLESAGFVDLATVSNPPATGPTAPTRFEGSEFSNMRLDRIFASPELARHLTSVRTVRQGKAAHASDHYPVVADIAL